MKNGIEITEFNAKFWAIFEILDFKGSQLYDAFLSSGFRAEIATFCYFCFHNFIKNAFAMLKSIQTRW